MAIALISDHVGTNPTVTSEWQHSYLTWKVFVPEIVSKAKRNKPTQSQIKLNKVN